MNEIKDDAGDGSLIKANKLAYEDDLIIDVLFSCTLFNLYMKTCLHSLGKSTKYNLFDKIWTVNEMIGMTTCDGEKLQGYLINCNTDKFTVFGKNTKETSWG